MCKGQVMTSSGTGLFWTKSGLSVSTQCSGGLGLCKNAKIEYKIAGWGAKCKDGANRNTRLENLAGPTLSSDSLFSAENIDLWKEMAA